VWCVCRVCRDQALRLRAAVKVAEISLYLLAYARGAARPLRLLPLRRRPAATGGPQRRRRAALRCSRRLLGPPSSIHALTTRHLAAHLPCLIPEARHASSCATSAQHTAHTALSTQHSYDTQQHST
jgi:hypothetical protein